MTLTKDRIRKGRKFEQVLDGARTIFLADGFEGASVDAIAKQAGVSKATLYSYFPDKRRLFTEVGRIECLRQAEAAKTSVDKTAPPRVVLGQAAKHITQFLLSDFAQAVFRVCVAESDRFPDLGREFYESGPRVGKKVLCDYLTEATACGALEIQDIDLAAHQFMALCKAEIFDKRVFGVQHSFTEAEVDRIIDSAVDMFLSRYEA